MLFAEKSQATLASLIEGSIKGDPRMQKLLYQQFASRMFSVCMRYAKNEADAEDLLQEGFVKAFRNLDKYRAEGHFEGWLRKIIVRTAISYYRSNVRRMNSQHISLDHSIEDHSSSAFDKLLEKDIACMVRQLPPGYRKVFTLYVMEGYNHKEIASILGCSEGNCKSQLNRSRMQLRKLLKKSA